MSQDKTGDEVPDSNDVELDIDEDPFEDESSPLGDTGDKRQAPGAEVNSVSATESQQQPEQDQSCVMLGPSKSGKTTLLTAIKRACDQPSTDRLNLEFIPGKETAEKIRIAIENIVGRSQGHGATFGVGGFPFEIHVNSKAPNFWTPPLEADLHVVMSDGGGEYLLPSLPTNEKEPAWQTARQNLIEAALDATSMILCVDVTMPGTTLLEKELAISFAEMSKTIPTSETIHWSAKLSAWIRRRPIPRPRTRWKRCLNVDRFLLLLTQVDKLCHQLPPSIDRTIRFAEMLDPVEQARELLGVSVLKTIRNALKPNAQLAVGVISAMGFHPITGEPFADMDGTPLNLNSETGEDILRRWTPFGIRDAIYFLSTGKCTGRVKELQTSDLDVGAEPLEFTYSVSYQREA